MRRPRSTLLTNTPTSPDVINGPLGRMQETEKETRQKGRMCVCSVEHA